MAATVHNLRARDTDKIRAENAIRTFTRNLRKALTDLMDDPLDSDSADEVITLLVHEGPSIRSTSDRLQAAQP